MSEKALIIFLIYNGTAFIFSLILLAIKRGEVNSIPFRKLLYSFIYAASYTFVPFFVIMLSLMIMGGSMNIIDSVNGITRGLNTGAAAKTLPVFLVSIVVIILAIVGMLKMFRAYNHILRQSLDLPKWQETLIAAAFFIAQIAYTNLVLDL